MQSIMKIFEMLSSKGFTSHTFLPCKNFLEQLSPKKDCYILATFVFGMMKQNYITLPIRKHMADHQMNKEK